ncbi:MAG: hypothetical protein Q8R82_15730 [Hyphomonadaceae bacterium]|nr:hypothetical protein [Hyphomonadaceae bacterium]
MISKILGTAFALSVSSQATAQPPASEAAALTYALKRICGWHLEGTSASSLFGSEVKLNGWTQSARGGGIIYDKSGDWGWIQVLYSTKDYSGRCMVSVTPANAFEVDVTAMRGAVKAFVSERFPTAKHEKDRLRAETNKDVTESVWTAESGRWSVQLGEMAPVQNRPILRAVWNRSF